jgi:hypothetical protein
METNSINEHQHQGIILTSTHDSVTLIKIIGEVLLVTETRLQHCPTHARSFFEEFYFQLNHVQGYSDLFELLEHASHNLHFPDFIDGYEDPEGYHISSFLAEATAIILFHTASLKAALQNAKQDPVSFTNDLSLFGYRELIERVINQLSLINNSKGARTAIVFQMEYLAELRVSLIQQVSKVDTLRALNDANRRHATRISDPEVQNGWFVQMNDTVYNTEERLDHVRHLISWIDTKLQKMAPTLLVSRTQYDVIRTFFLAAIQNEELLIDDLDLLMKSRFSVGGKDIDIEEPVQFFVKTGPHGKPASIIKNLFDPIRNANPNVTSKQIQLWIFNLFLLSDQKGYSFSHTKKLTD